jgi:hypothetical protein
LTGNYKLRKQEERFEGSSEVTPRVHTDEISVVPSATYKFSSNIDASASFTYQNNNDLRTGIKRRVRQIAIKVVLSF